MIPSKKNKKCSHLNAFCLFNAKKYHLHTLDDCTVYEIHNDVTLFTIFDQTLITKCSKEDIRKKLICKISEKKCFSHRETFR